MVAPVHNFGPKILPKGSAKLRSGRRAGDLIFQIHCGPVQSSGTWPGRPKFVFLGVEKEKQCDERGWWGAQRPRLG